MTQPSRLDNPERPPEPMIPGIYNYCDRWCERCMFSARCRVFRDVRVMHNALARGQDPKTELGGLDAADIAEAEAERTPEERAEWAEFLERANVIPTERELADVDAWLARRDAWIEMQPVSRDSHEYGRISLDVCGPLQAMAAPADDVVRTAIDTVLHLAVLIPAKIFRALTGLPAAGTATGDDDWDAAGLDDANGSAKVVRLAIAESREAWTTLGGVPAIDGVAASMIRRLEAMDAEMTRLFPGALAFIRPGFDDGGAESWE